MSTLDLQAAARWVDDHGECLYRYALVRARKPEVAQDFVQETFLAAMRGHEKFGGRSSERSWLMDGVPSKEICAILAINDSNLLVILHRARMALRECLEMNWFDQTAGGRA